MADQRLEHSISPAADRDLVDRNLQVRFSPDIFRTQTYGGVSRYITELHRGLTARGVDSRILAWLHINAYLRRLPGTVGLDIAKVRPIRARQALTKGTDRALERLWCTRQDRATIWHKSMFDRRVAVGPRLAVTVYDMIHERYPDQFGSRDVIPHSKRPWCDAADVVFAISETTRHDLLERFGLPAEKVKVTHLGVTVVEPTPGPLPFSRNAVDPLRRRPFEAVQELAARSRRGAGLGTRESIGVLRLAGQR